MMLQQDGSTHEWVPGRNWDFIITLDDATSEHYSMFFVEKERTVSSFRAIRQAGDCGTNQPLQAGILRDPTALALARKVRAKSPLGQPA